METFWFVVVTLMLATYVVLDGFDLGAGALHLWLAESSAERKAVLASIGPVWDGNEVWLLAAGGTLFFAFPGLYASSFSGFYLPLMMVLWLLILRGVSIEFRNHIESAPWQTFWDTVFSGASILLAIFFGAALGNVVRGVPLDTNASFFLPLWTDFSPGRDAGILDWYTVLVAVAALLVLAHHGALWVALKTEGALEERAKRAAERLWWGVLVAAVAVTWASFGLQPHLAESFATRPWGYIFPALGAAGLLFTRLWKGSAAFWASSLLIGGMLASAAFGLYPYVLPSNDDPAQSLTIQNTAASPYGLSVGLVWFIPGIALAAVYFIYTYRKFSGKIPAETVLERKP
jgi:cytochrome bd ubiquinol oxidase subunit II